MKTLILRTFAHTKIWEGIEPMCHFEHAQKRQILEWEPDYLKLRKEDIDRAIGIYTEKYFSGYYTAHSGSVIIADSGSDNEKIISELRVVDKINSPLPFLDNQNRICLNMELINKIWSNLNKDLMLRIDEKLINAKMEELKNRGETVRSSPFKPLSFCLDSETVNFILNNTNI